MDNNTYSLKISIEGAEIEDSPVANAEKEPKKPKQTPEEKLQSLVAHRVTRTAFSTTKQLIVNNVNVAYGNTEVQNRLGMAMGLVEKGASIVTGGMALAKTIGISTGAGIGVTLAMTLMDKVSDIIVKMNEIENNKRIENEQLQVLRGRAGVQFNRSRSGE